MAAATPGHQAATQLGLVASSLVGLVKLVADSSLVGLTEQGAGSNPAQVHRVVSAARSTLAAPTVAVAEGSSRGTVLVPEGSATKAGPAAGLESDHRSCPHRSQAPREVSVRHTFRHVRTVAGVTSGL